VRGPLFSGPLGGGAVLDALVRRLRGAGTVVVIGPLWLGETLAAEVPTILLVEPEERPRARRTVRRTTAAGRRLTVMLAGVDLPLARGSVDALLIDSVSTLAAPEAAEWLATLVPVLRQGGRLLAADVTEDPADEARLAALWLASALTDIAQERPRSGVVVTSGRAPAAELVRTRFQAA